MTTNKKTSNREILIEWLVWNDRNGVYRDEDSKAEGYKALTLEEAAQMVVDNLNDGNETVADVAATVALAAAEETK